MTQKWNYLDNLEYQQKVIKSTISLFDELELERIKENWFQNNSIFNGKPNPFISKVDWENLVFPKLQEIQKENYIVNQEKILYLYNDKFPIFDIEKVKAIHDWIILNVVYVVAHQQLHRI